VTGHATRQIPAAELRRGHTIRDTNGMWHGVLRAVHTDDDTITATIYNTGLNQQVTYRPDDTVTVAAE
jgi:hypothetical protein